MEHTGRNGNQTPVGEKAWNLGGTGNGNRRCILGRENNGTVTLTGIIAEYADVMAYLQSWNYDYTYGEGESQSGTVQKCLREAERQTDEQIRLSTLYKAEKALMEDVPMIPLQLRKESLLLNRNLTGFETSMNLAGGGYEFLYADFK